MPSPPLFTPAAILTFDLQNQISSLVNGSFIKVVGAVHEIL